MSTTSQTSRDALAEEPIDLLFQEHPDGPSASPKEVDSPPLQADELRNLAFAAWKGFLSLLRRLFPAWLRRRAWLLVAATLAGAFGGLTYGMFAHASYAAQATLAVPAGATATNPGSANEAQALAITYATVLQEDVPLLSLAAQELGVPVGALSHNLSVSVQTGTSVLLLRYTAPTSSDAIRGVNAIAAAIVDHKTRGSATPLHTSVVPLHTVDVVQLATSAQSSGHLAKYGLPIGVFLGLLVGLIIALIAERIDPRADSASQLAEVFDCPVASVPSELSVPEFGHAVLNSPSASNRMILAPLRWWDAPAAYSIERTLAPDYPDKTISISKALEKGMAHRLNANSELVLVVRSGEHMRSVGDALERLRLTGRKASWIALLDRNDLYD